MARNEIFIGVPPPRVFEVLEQPDTYGYWVVGSKHVRDADRTWPRVGAKFHHTVGFGPLTLRDNTEVERVERPRRLVLRAKTRPVGMQRVSLELHPQGEGTCVVMEEAPVGGLPAKLASLPLDVLLRARNTESLRRLKELAEER